MQACGCRCENAGSWRALTASATRITGILDIGDMVASLWICIFLRVGWRSPVKPYVVCISPTTLFKDIC